MTISTKNIPSEILFILRVYLFVIGVFTFFRLLLISIQYSVALSVSKKLLLHAFVMGFRFDTVVTSYIIAFPALLLLINILKQEKNILFIHISKWYFISLFSIAFLVSCIDIPYYSHYLSRLTVSVFNWFNNPSFVFKLVFSDSGNYFFLFIFLSLIYFNYKLINKWSKELIFKKTNENNTLQNKISRKLIFSVLLIGFVFIGIRGRIALKSPIQWGTAFISDNNFVNQLGLNPNFTLLKSYFNSLNPENKKIHLMDEKLALKIIRADLKITDTISFSSPIARKINTMGNSLNANVVIVIMESMGLSKTRMDNNPINMTPYLDSISKLSYTFTNVFSAGIHTYNGVYATLFSMPSLMNQHTMNASETTNQPFTGIAKTLNDYQSVFICPHDEEFDNMSGFLKTNGFKKIIGQKDFPLSEVVSGMGIPDDVLFDHAKEELNKMSKSSRPFLATILTGSDHEPINVPTDNGFVPKTKEKKQQIVEYADWSINKFLKACQNEKWFDNTLFVFVADHGSWYRDFYVMNLSFHKIPLLIFAPKILNQAKTIEAVGGQIDVFPTIMGILNKPYINNTFGVDLLKEGRRYIAFSADDKLGCINENYFWYHNYQAENEFLLYYRNRDEKQYIIDFPAIADSLKNYSHAFLQTTQWMLDNKMVGSQTK